MCSTHDTMDTDSSVKVQSDMNKIKNLRPQNEEQAGEMRIVTIGKTGTGKSATGNSILGKKEFESKLCGSSVTNKCKSGSTERFGRKIVLIDTPGLFDTKFSNKQITTELVRCISITSPGPHAFLLIVNVGRFTKEEHDTVKHFVDHFGDGIYNFLTVVFTRADDLENDKMTFEEYVKEVPQELKDILQLCDNRCVPFNNKLTGADQELQVKRLISIIDDVINKNGGSCFTNEMYQDAEKRIREREEEIKIKLEEEKRRKEEEIRLQLKNEYDKRCAEKEQERVLLANQIKELKLKQQETQCTANMERIEQLQKQIEEKDRKSEKEFEDYRKEGDRKLETLRDEYQQRLNPSNLRDFSRRRFEEERDIMAFFIATRVVVTIANAFAALLLD